MEQRHTDVQHAAEHAKARAAIYLRVSTSKRSARGDDGEYEQDPAVQEQPLLDLISHRGWQLVRAYSDRASGAKEMRPGLGELMRDARRGLFDIVLVWRFDRFARSAKQLIDALEEFRVLKVDFVSHQEALDTSTPIGRAMFTLIAAMAELERSGIRERVASGLEFARRQGTRSGRPIGRPRVVFRRDRVRELRADGLSWSQIALQLGIGATTARRAYAEGTERRLC